jgi:hypothetical protein
MKMPMKKGAKKPMAKGKGGKPMPPAMNKGMQMGMPMGMPKMADAMMKGKGKK